MSETGRKKIQVKVKPPPTINLYDNQIIHVKRMNEILNKYPFALDFSMLRTGKTYTTSYLFRENQYKRFNHLVVISPVSVKVTWLAMEREYKIPLDKIISYCEVRSVKFKQPKHGLLNRRDYMDQVRSADGHLTDVERVEYTCTNDYMRMVNEGLLLVIDEIQNVKNISNQLDACRELIRPIVEQFNVSNEGAKSRLIMLSGSPIDKRIQTTHLFRLLNIMTDERLAVNNPQTSQMIWRGMQEIEDYCVAHFGQQNVMNVRQQFEMSHHRAMNTRQSPLNDYCYDLFQNFIRIHCSDAMDPLQLPVKITKLNAYYNMQNTTDKDLLIKGIKLLSTSSNFNDHDQTVDHGHNGIESLRGIVRALMMIETAKINLFAKIVDDSLTKSPNLKMVVCVNYTETINDLMTLLSQYKPLRLDGGMTHIKRADTLSKFQADDNCFRLIIGNLNVCSTGIALDDQYGSHPRMCLVSPNYSSIMLYQLSHRFHSSNTKSDSLVHFVLCKDNAEINILNALAKKGNVMKEVTPNQAAGGVVFPGEYPVWEEQP